MPGLCCKAVAAAASPPLLLHCSMPLPLLLRLLLLHRRRCCHRCSGFAAGPDVAPATDTLALSCPRLDGCMPDCALLRLLSVTVVRFGGGCLGAAASSDQAGHATLHSAAATTSTALSTSGPPRSAIPSTDGLNAMPYASTRCKLASSSHPTTGSLKQSQRAIWHIVS
jgi:hypothetical protein